HTPYRRLERRQEQSARVVLPCFIGLAAGNAYSPPSPEIRIALHLGALGGEPRLVLGTVPRPMLPATVAIRVAMIPPGVQAVLAGRVALPDHLGGQAGDDGARRHDGALGHECAAGDDGAPPDRRAVHEGGSDADEAVVVDGARVDRDVVGHRAELSDAHTL